MKDFKKFHQNTLNLHAAISPSSTNKKEIKFESGNINDNSDLLNLDVNENIEEIEVEEV